MELVKWAYELAESLLAAPLPRRWQHSLGAAEKATTLAPLLGAEAELLQASAVLHDVGYAPTLAQTGFHPLDGARFLRQEGADERLVSLVAHHSCALLEAELRGLRRELGAEFPVERPDLTDALLYCDLTTTPEGEPTSAERRMAEIRHRYGPDALVTHFISAAAPEIRAAVQRVEERLRRAS